MKEIKLNAYHQKQNELGLKAVEEMSDLPWSLEQTKEQQKRLDAQASNFPPTSFDKQTKKKQIIWHMDREDIVESLLGIGFGFLGAVTLFGFFLPWRIVWIAGVIGSGFVLLHIILTPIIITKKFIEKKYGPYSRIGRTRRIE